jgi:hypothetical protein
MVMLTELPAVVVAPQSRRPILQGTTAAGSGGAVSRRFYFSLIVAAYARCQLVHVPGRQTKD